MRKKKAGTMPFCGVLLFILGGVLYNFIELLWRGRTHWTMFLVGGWCFSMIGKIFHCLNKCKLGIRCAVSALGVTIIEFVSGCYFNRRRKMKVWDYSQMPFNIKGQVCLLYSVLWGFLSIPAGWLYGRCERSIRRCYFAEGQK